MGIFVNLNNIKLIIWDLDDTFWRGNLEENTIQIRPEVINFIRKSVNRGIMHSICSKNNYDKVRQTFYNQNLEDVWNCFIFPSINWNPKGERIKEILNLSNLRAENTLFIDDNTINLNEVKFCLPQINIAEAKEIENIIKNLYFVNSFDPERTRLKNYKILEKKNVAKSIQNYSNEDFLRHSHIKICIKDLTQDKFGRIQELIKRTHQLNYTKSLEEINPNYDNKYILVKDDYGNYGICGFYSLNKNELVHFLFSCRILGMGIEQYVYNKLGKPKINIQEPVTIKLEKNKVVDWIEEDIFDIETDKENISEINILFKGPCDLLSATDYINANCNIDTEFPYYNENFQYILEHTHLAYIVQSHKQPSGVLNKISTTFPFPPAENFKTKFFDSKYQIIFLSILTSLHSGLYINKNDGTYIVFGYANCDITNPRNWEKTLANVPVAYRVANLAGLEKFSQDYYFAGEVPTEEIIKNLEYIKNNLNSETKLILILGSEKECSKTLAGYENMAKRHSVINREVEKFASQNEIETINLTDFVESDSDYIDCINHFERKVYLKLGAKCSEIIKNTNKKVLLLQ